MLKKLSLSILSVLVLANGALASDSENVKIVSIEESPISRTDVAAISTAWSEGNSAVFFYMVNSYVPEAADFILGSFPELKNNKVALASVTIAMVILDQRTQFDRAESLKRLSTHKYLVNMPEISWDEAVNAFQTYSI